MRIRLSQLRQIIKEEVRRAITEQPYVPKEKEDDEYEGPDDNGSMEVEPGFGRTDPYGPYDPPKGSRRGGKY